MASYPGARRIWNKHSEFAGKADADKVQKEIDLIASQDPNGKCTDEGLVDYARNNPNSESHNCFEWNDTTAAEKYRLHQAARIKVSIITVYDKTDKDTESSVNQNTSVPIQVVTNHALKTPGDGHKNIEFILQDKNDSKVLDEQMKQACIQFMDNFERRWCLAPSFNQVFPKLQAFVNSL